MVHMREHLTTAQSSQPMDQVFHYILDNHRNANMSLSPNSGIQLEAAIGHFIVRPTL